MSAVLEHFDGADIVHSRDAARLAGQIDRVYNAMQFGHWFSLRQIASLTGDAEASISAQLRNLRKARFGGHTINRRHVKNGLYEYQLAMKASNG